MNKQANNSKRANDIRFWTCVIGAGVDLVLSFILPDKGLFLTCAACFAIGALVTYAADTDTK